MRFLVRVVLLTALSLTPALPETLPAELVTKIQGLIEAGDLAGARTELQFAVKVYPDSAVLQNFLGVLEAQSGNYSLAEAGFKRAIRLDQHLAPAYLNLGHLYQENGAHDPEAVSKGAAVYLELLKIDPTNSEAQYQAAYLLQLKGSYLASLKLLATLPADLGQKAQALAVKCTDEAGLGRIREARATAAELVRALDLVETDVLTVLHGLSAKNQSQLERTLLEGLADRSKASQESLLRLGALDEAEGSLGRARKTLEAAASAGTVTVPLLTSLARIAYRQKDQQGALGYLAHARDLDPNNAAVHFFFGIVCVDMDLPIDAERSLQEAVKLDGENPYYNYALGAVTAQVRKWDSAIPYFEKYVKLRPQDPRGKLALATAHFQTSQEDLARKELQEVARYPETRAGAHLYLGKLALRQDDFTAAEEEFKRSQEANADNGDACAELGFVYVQQEKYTEAQEVLRRSLELQPDGVRANMVLLTLYHRTHDSRETEQTARVQQLIKKREESAKALLRTVQVSPY